jgi:hypothetical protein
VVLEVVFNIVGLWIARHVESAAKLAKLIMVVSVDLELVIAGGESLWRDFGKGLLKQSYKRYYFDGRG